MTASNPDAAPEAQTRHAQVTRFTRIRDVDWVQLGVLLGCALALLVIWLHYRPS